ncbi:hypothetical protein LXL04_000622 [Taraxacum kok-saghyz]
MSPQFILLAPSPEKCHNFRYYREQSVEVGTGCFKWSQPSISHSSWSSSAISSPSRLPRSLTDSTLVCRSLVFGKKLNRSQSCETLKLSTRQQPIRRIVSANLDSEFSDEEFSREIQELALRLQLSGNDKTDSSENDAVSESQPEKSDQSASIPATWAGDMISASIERKANRLELPFSLRIIQKKKQWEEGFRETGESAYCSMKKALSSMVFIIQELQSYTLQMRANYSVYSMSNNIAIASLPSPATVESISTIENQSNTKFDSTTVDTFSVNTAGKTFTTSIGGLNGGGGGKSRPVGCSTDGDGKFGESTEHQSIITNESSSSTSNPTRTGEESVSGQKTELTPVTVKIGGEVGTEEYMKTDSFYQIGLSKESDNPLLLANYAQFLYLFAHDHKRAEGYFKRASEIEPKNAESLCKYASFLWHAKKELWDAEENFLEAISVDPDNSFYWAAYAQFLWANGAKDTCFPLDLPDNVISDEF